ncbi:hypothetical protein Tsubulata_006877, partial [Turnera subulata]
MSCRCEKNRAYGFGYDSAANDYKVFVVAVHRYVPPIPMVQIFSLKTGSWRRVEKPDRYLPDIREADRGLFLNGALHWKRKYAEKITAFDLAEEKFYDVPAPPQEREWGQNGIGIILYRIRRIADTCCFTCMMAYLLLKYSNGIRILKNLIEKEWRREKSREALTSPYPSLVMNKDFEH